MKSMITALLLTLSGSAFADTYSAFYQCKASDIRQQGATLKVNSLITINMQKTADDTVALT